MMTARQKAWRTYSTPRFLIEEMKNHCGSREATPLPTLCANAQNPSLRRK